MDSTTELHIAPFGQRYRCINNILLYRIDNRFYHIIYKSSNRNKVHDKFGIMYFENRITMQIRSRDYFNVQPRNYHAAWAIIKLVVVALICMKSSSNIVPKY